MKFSSVLAVLAVVSLSGCAETDPPPVAVQPVTIGVSDFCETLRATLPGNPGHRPRWSVTDDPRTVADARKVGAVVGKRCNPKKKPARQP